MKKVGILYIATGEYWKFWNDFFESSQKHFLQDCELYYFLFTDNTGLLNLSSEKIYSNYLEHQKWPYPTLMRYHVFHNHREIFRNMDYLIFCNANLVFLKNIRLEELFLDKPMFATLHPGYFRKSYRFFPYEKNVKSTAYLKRTANSVYVCGGFNGGLTEYFLKMSEILKNNIDQDLKNGIIAKWHDESHFNKYVALNRCDFNILFSSYCYPENMRLNIEKIILVRDKDKVFKIIHKGKWYYFRYNIMKWIRNIKNTILDLVKC